jgi:hypothetical protein
MKVTHTNYLHPRHLRAEENGDVWCIAPSHSKYTQLAKGNLPSFVGETVGENVAVFVPFPEDFPEKGKYRTWDKHWNPTGYADTPHHRGQLPERFPPDALPIEAHLGGYIRDTRGTNA